MLFVLCEEQKHHNSKLWIAKLEPRPIKKKEKGRSKWKMNKMTEKCWHNIKMCWLHIELSSL